MRRHRLWVLLIDETRARILRAAPGGDAGPATDLVLRAGQPRLRRLMVARAGTGLAVFGDRHPAVTARSQVLLKDAGAFAQEVVAVLEAHRLAGELDRLAIFATPVMLALLRERLSAGLRRCLVREWELARPCEAQRDSLRELIQSL